MILLRQNMSNQIYVTAFENVDTSVDEIVYLFNFINNLTGNQENVILNDISPCPSRYQHFELNVPEDLYVETGYHDYVIYQMPMTFPQTFDILDAIKILENGKALVENLIFQDIPEFDTNFIKNVPEWNG